MSNNNNNNNKMNKNVKNQKTYKQQKSVNGSAKKLKKQKSQELLDKTVTAPPNTSKEMNKINQRKPYNHKSLLLVNEKPNNELNSTKYNSQKATNVQQQQQQQNPLTDRDNNILPPIPKMERSRSFFLTRTISKMLNHLSGSKENLSTTSSPSTKEKDINSNNVPYQFIRSKSMILLKTSKRKTYGPQLEKLSEESERPNSPEQISNITTTATATASSSATTTAASTSAASNTINSRSVFTPSCSNTLPIIKEPKNDYSRRISLDFGRSSASAIVPSDFAISSKSGSSSIDRRKSGAFVETLKRMVVVHDRRKSVSTKWSSSLQSLQEIDNMVSYENLSFIDYDKFNEYEKHLERQLSYNTTVMQHSLMLPPPAPSPVSPCPSIIANCSNSSTNSVRYREKRGRSSLNKDQTPKSIAEVQKFENQNSSTNDIENNWQTHSLDDRKLIEIGENYQSDFQKFEYIGNEDNSNNCDKSIYSSTDTVDYSAILRPKPSPLVMDDNMLLLERSNNNLLSLDYSASSPNLNSVKSKSLTHLDVLSYPVNDSSNKSNIPDQSVPECSDTLSPQSQNDIPIYDSVSQKLKKTPQQQQQQHVISPNITLYQHHPSTATSISATTSNSSACNKICCLGKTTISSNETSITNDQNDLIHHISPKTISGTALAAASLSAASPHLIQITKHPSPTGSSNSVGSVVTGIIKSGSIKKKSTFMLNRKPGLSKSEVSSSEYFSVHFCTENGGIEEELITIKKGVTLLEAIDGALKRRNLTFSQINIADSNIHSLAETGSPPYGSLIDENIDTENLLGKILIVTEKNDSYLKSSRLGSLQKAASFGSRARPPRLLSSASTEETSSEPDPKIVPAKQLKQRWSGLFGVKNPQQNQLCELLSKFSKHGGPPKKSTIHLDHPNYEADALTYLQNAHKCWRDFVVCDDLPDNEIKIQSAIWELVTTEIDYIHTLQTVTDLFLACLEALQEENILTDVDQNKLFSNIREICEANLKFWTLYLYPMVAHSIFNHTPMHIDYFNQGFVTFGSTFSPYKVYCAEQSTCQFYCKELNRTNTVFTTYLAWCESQKNCNRLRLADILVRPMQRLTKYSLLLIAIRKHIIIENDAEMIDSMIRSVENFVYSVNTHLSTRQENERLKGIMARIESYDVVEANNEQLEKFIKQYSQMFDLCAPMRGCSNQHCRHLFMEGDLKLKDNISKSDVHCFLLTDILLICKTISKKSQGALKVIRQPYFTDRLMVKHKDNALYCVYLNELQVAIAAFTLQCSEAKNWHDGLTKAKHIYTRLKQSIQWDMNLRGYGIQSSSGDNVNMLGVKKSPLNSSRGSRVSSLNNSHSGSVELNDSRNISTDFEKANSLSSDEGTNALIQKPKTPIAVSPQKQKASTANTLSVQPLHNLGQSLPNLTSQNQSSNNTLLVPGYGRGCPSTNLLSPSHRGISYPPPSPTRATLRRGFAFSSTIKNPPLVKTRNITSQNSVNWYQQIPTTKAPVTTTGTTTTTISQQQQQQEGLIHHSSMIASGCSGSGLLPSSSTEIINNTSSPSSLNQIQQKIPNSNSSSSGSTLQNIITTAPITKTTTATATTIELLQHVTTESDV